jgi:serine/threonine-protein kinase
MSADRTEEFIDLTPRSDEAWDRFEEAWGRGESPRIEDYLVGFEGAEWRALLAGLLASEVEHRRRRGQRPAPEDYLGRFPDQAAVIDAAFAGATSRPAGGRPRRAAPRIDAGRNLLFGILALQNNFIGRDDLLAAFAVWVADKARPLARILVERGAIDEARCRLLEALVAEHLKQHGGDTEASLAAVSSLGPVRADLGRLGDADLQASLAATTSRAAEVGGSTEATADYTPSSRRAGARFRILRFHREGGLGRVYVARDEELGREVALKEIRPEKSGEADLRGRFVMEADINGGLEHPGIVPVYSLGTYDDGRPFYAMRFVEGDSLKEAIEAYHAAHPRPDPTAIEFRKLLGRFVDVCEAIAFAHSRGVLHRDLKPHNVMLGRYGETLLIDWGLAKATGRREPAGSESAIEATLVPPSGSGHAPTVGVLGSPPYMSPEQAAGVTESLGPATDVYGLGAILFALLTGEPPVEGGTIEEILDRARRGAIRPPRSLNPNIPRGLEAVCLKALATGPGDRYPTARALADDVERWLADEPVSAWREPLSIRARRWVQPNRTIVAAAAIAMMVGLLAFGIAYSRESAINTRLAQVNANLAKAKLESDRRLDQTFQAIEDYYSGVGQEVLLGQEDFRDLRARLLERPKQFYEQMTRELGANISHDETTRSHMAKGHYGLGRILSLLGRYDEAKSQFQSAIELYEALVASHPDAGTYQNSLALSHGSLGRAQSLLGERKKGIESFQRAIAIASKLTENHPEVPEYQDVLAHSYNNLGISRSTTGDRAGAVESHRRAIAIWSAFKGAKNGVSKYQDRLAGSYANLATLQQSMGDLNAAATSHRESIAIWAGLVADHPDVPDYRHGLAMSYAAFGRFQNLNGDRRGAADSDRQAVLITAKLSADHPNVPEYLNSLALNYSNLGFDQQTMKDFAGAAGSHAEAIKIRSKLVASNPHVPKYQDGLATSYANLGIVQRHTGDLTGAAESHRQAITVSSKLVSEHPDVPDYQNGLARAYTNFGNVQESLGNLPAAASAQLEAIRIRSRLMAAQPRVTEYQRTLALNYFNLGGSSRPIELHGIPT